MKIEDIIHILCRLTQGSFDFDNEQSSFTYLFSERNYNVSLKRLKGKLVSFTVEDAGENKDENN